MPLLLLAIAESAAAPPRHKIAMVYSHARCDIFDERRYYDAATLDYAATTLMLML